LGSGEGLCVGREICDVVLGIAVESETATIEVVLLSIVDGATVEFTSIDVERIADWFNPK